MRKLPRQHNPLLADEHTPKHDTLVARRRLGQTDLKVSPGATEKSTFVGVFDYAHLRVSLPQDLKSSGIFSAMKNGQYPESYFLMRRSKDGYISATGMYKAAFPWSSLEEEQTERKHHKGLPSGSGEEVAGNVWISPEDSLSLAEEYSIRPWILALLDPAPIEIGPKDKLAHGNISTPPKFVASTSSKDKLFPPPDMAGSTQRSRAKRSTSPAKSQASSVQGGQLSPRKIASPRKRGPRGGSAKPEDKTSVEKSSKALQDGLQNGVTLINGAPGSDEVKVAAQETVQKTEDTKITKTTVSVTMPAGHPDLEIPNNLEGVVEKAKEMVEEANKHDAAKAAAAASASAPPTKATGAGKKRKASSALTKEGEDAESSEKKEAKRQKTGLEEQLVTERVRSRALLGLTATLAIGAIIPYFL